MEKLNTAQSLFPQFHSARMSPILVKEYIGKFYSNSIQRTLEKNNGPIQSEPRL
jgi:hypothetical protein